MEHPAGGMVPLPPSLDAWLAVAWLGILGSGVAYLLFFPIVRAWGATRTTMVTYVTLVVSIALGVIMLNEQLLLVELLGGLLIVCGLLLANASFGQRRLYGRGSPLPATPPGTALPSGHGWGLTTGSGLSADGEVDSTPAGGDGTSAADGDEAERGRARPRRAGNDDREGPEAGQRGGDPDVGQTRRLCVQVLPATVHEDGDGRVAAVLGSAHGERDGLVRDHAGHRTEVVGDQDLVGVAGQRPPHHRSRRLDGSDGCRDPLCARRQGDAAGSLREHLHLRHHLVGVRRHERNRLAHLLGVRVRGRVTGLPRTGVQVAVRLGDDHAVEQRAAARCAIAAARGPSAPVRPPAARRRGHGRWVVAAEPAARCSTRGRFHAAATSTPLTATRWPRPPPCERPPGPPRCR